MPASFNSAALRLLDRPRISGLISAPGAVASMRTTGEPARGSLVDAGPASVVDPVPASFVDAGPASVVDPVPASFVDAGPASVVDPVPASFVDTGPASVVEPAVRSVAGASNSIASSPLGAQ